MVWVPVVWSPRIPENERNRGPQTRTQSTKLNHLLNFLANILNLKIGPPTRKRRVPFDPNHQFLGFKMFVDSGGLSLSELLATRIGFASAVEVLLSVACCWTEAIISKTQPLRPRVCTEIPGEKNRMMASEIRFLSSRCSPIH